MNKTIDSEESHAINLYKVLSVFMAKLENHPIYNNNYFNLLKTSNWNRESYSIHRANFFYRTGLTVKAIAQICAKAAIADDQATLILYAYILNEETGNGKHSTCHGVLMEKSHNLFGEVEFHLDPLLVKDAKGSGLIIEETLEYREKIQQLVTGSYHSLLGVALALESHADRMLYTFRGAFRKNRSRLDEDTFKKNVEIYFNAHLDGGVEERHAADARQCVINNCNTEDKLNEILYGAETALQLQQRMWDGMYRAITQLQN